MYLYVKLNCDANFVFPVESKDCINSASYEYRNMSARKGAQFVPIEMPTICRKTFPLKTTKMLSTRNFSVLMMSYLISVLVFRKIFFSHQDTWKHVLTNYHKSLLHVYEFDF